MHALLIIDMQQGCFPKNTPKYRQEEVIGNINRLSASFRQSGQPVIFVRHDGTAENELFPGSDDWQVLPSLDIEATDLFVEKTANDSFYKTNLAELLQEKGIGEVVISGSATDFCVDATVQSGLVRDYNLIIAEDAHTTTDRPHASGEALVHHYNWIWSNLTPTGGRVSVRSTEELLAK